MTKTWFEFLMVDSRWAMVMVVRPSSVELCNASRAACTLFSDSLSKAEVASSSNSSCGFFASARAIATRCFCPPDSWPPPMPTKVSSFSGKVSMNSQACACLTASSASFLVMLGLPPLMFSKIVVAKSTGS
mmetsp:Transcript_100376/g.288365  ORF Transcript_100376/g.288365 Transcript_100376/m.288365 type:complete len:131 (+) Transcript_100376:2477-2869(+)